MLRAAKIAMPCCLAFVLWGYQPAAAGCQVISATHSAPSRLAALQLSQALAVENANNLRRAKGWSYVSMRPHKVRPNPFWKSVRPVVPQGVILKPDVVTSNTYTTCFRGVVVPFVCTSGSTVCGH